MGHNRFLLMFTLCVSILHKATLLKLLAYQRCQPSKVQICTSPRRNLYCYIKMYWKHLGKKLYSYTFLFKKSVPNVHNLYRVQQICTGWHLWQTSYSLFIICYECKWNYSFDYALCQMLRTDIKWLHKWFLLKGLNLIYSIE